MIEMVLCFIALIYFSIVGLFSARHRPMAKQAFDCVFRKMTLRKCEADFDRKTKIDLVARLLKVNPMLAKLVNIHFESIISVLTVLFVLSFFYSIYGFYNFVAFGNCEGQNSNAFCIYKDIFSLGNVELPKNYSFSENSLVLGSGTEQGKRIVEFGCYSCPYTRKGEEKVHELIAEGYSIEFKHYPIPEHNNSYAAAVYMQCAYEMDDSTGKQNYMAMRKELFESQEELWTRGKGLLEELGAENGFDVEKLENCSGSQETNIRISQQIEEGRTAVVKGTPTFFVEEQGKWKRFDGTDGLDWI